MAVSTPRYMTSTFSGGAPSQIASLLMKLETVTTLSAFFSVCVVKGL